MNNEHSELRGAIDRYMTDRGSLQRSLPPSASPKRDERLREFTKLWLDQLGNLEFGKLTQDGKVDYLLLKNQLAHELRQIDIRGKETAESASLVPFAGPILELDLSRRELQTMDWSKVAGRLTNLTKQIGEARRALEREPRGKDQAKRVVVNRALAATEGLRATLRGWFGFYDGYDPLFTWWVEEPYKSVDQAIDSYAGLLRQRYGAVAGGSGDDGGPGPGRRGRGGGGPRDETAAAAGRTDPSAARQSEIVGNPIGREALLSELQYEMIAYTPEELIEIARKELAWCEGQMKQAAREMGKGDDWKAALEHVKTLHVEPGKQPALIRDLALEAIEYMDRNNLVTVPQLCRDSWRMNMMTPERQLVNPFFTGGEVISVSFPTNSMPHESKLMSLRGNNIHFSRATVFHEVIPGHHLQGYMTSRYKTVPPPVQHGVLGRGLGPLLGALALGQGLRQIAREQGRHAFLAHAPLCADHVLAGLSSRKDDAQGVHRPPGRSHRPRTRQRNRRSAAIVHNVVRPAVPGGLPAGRAANPRSPSRAGGIRKNDRPQFPRRHSQGKRHSHRNGSCAALWIQAQARLEAGMEVLSRGSR